jgi:phage regulator Rha-like protein
VYTCAACRAPISGAESAMKKFQYPLVVPMNGEARASSEILAAGMGQQHASVLKLVRRHLTTLEELGLVRFEIRPRAAGKHGGGDVEIAHLNERQATLLISFMRNSHKVVEFKVALIKEFYRMRDELSCQRQDLWQQMQALIAKEVESKVRASFGSHLMLVRKKEIPPLKSERKALEAQIQPSLLN